MNRKRDAAVTVVGVLLAMALVLWGQIGPGIF